MKSALQKLGLYGAEIALEFSNQSKMPYLVVNSPSNLNNEITKMVNPQLCIFTADDNISGKIWIKPVSKKLEHNGIKIELIGQIETIGGSNQHYSFTSLTRELDIAGHLESEKVFDFDFTNVEKRWETYFGVNVCLRYFIRIIISRNYLPDIKREFDFAVQNVKNEPPKTNEVLKMEVGIDECLHIEFEYDKSKYCLDDIIVGQINFYLVRIKIKNMELQILKKESCGYSGSAVLTNPTHEETDIVAKFEIMDGAPIKGEKIPIRLYLKPYLDSLTPTYKNISNRFCVKYFLNLVLIDEEDRRYFKQQEFKLYRRTIESLPMSNKSHIYNYLFDTKSLSSSKSNEEEKDAENNVGNDSKPVPYEPIFVE